MYWLQYLPCRSDKLPVGISRYSAPAQRLLIAPAAQQKNNFSGFFRRSAMDLYVYPDVCDTNAARRHCMGQLRGEKR